MHTSRQPIRWADMDMLGHVNNTVFFRYCEQARIEWTYGLHEGGDAYAETGPVIVNASCTFLLPLVYPGEVEVRMFLADPGRTSVGSYYEILKDGTKHADGAAKLVWIDSRPAAACRFRIASPRRCARWNRPAAALGNGG